MQCTYWKFDETFSIFFFSFHDDLGPKSSRNAKKMKKIISSTFKIQLISQTFNRLTVDIQALYFSRKRKKNRTKNFIFTLKHKLKFNFGNLKSSI